MELKLYKWTVKIESCVDNCSWQSWNIVASCWIRTGATSKVQQCRIVMDFGLFLNYCPCWTVVLNNCRWAVPNSVYREQYAWIIVLTSWTVYCDESWSCIIICLVESLHVVLNFLLILTCWWVMRRAKACIDGVMRSLWIVLTRVVNIMLNWSSWYSYVDLACWSLKIALIGLVSFAFGIICNTWNELYGRFNCCMWKTWIFAWMIMEWKPAKQKLRKEIMTLIFAKGRDLCGLFSWFYFFCNFILLFE